MIAFLGFISAVARILGFVEFAEGLAQRSEAKHKAQRAADAPVTDKEWTDAAEKNDL